MERVDEMFPWKVYVGDNEVIYRVDGISGDAWTYSSESSGGGEYEIKIDAFNKPSVYDKKMLHYAIKRKISK